MTNDERGFWGDSRLLVKIGRAAFLILGLTLIADSGVRIYLANFQRPAPFRYLYSAYRQVQACPGDKLVYEQAFLIEAIPSVVTLVETWASMDRGGATVIPDREERYAIHLREAPPITTMLTQSVPDLPPGNYEFRQAGFTENSMPDGYSINVKILDCEE